MPPAYIGYMDNGSPDRTSVDVYFTPSYPLNFINCEFVIKNSEPKEPVKLNTRFDLLKMEN